MLVYKAQQVITASAVVSKAYAFTDEKTKEEKSGTSIYSDVTVLGTDGSVAVIRIKAKTEAEVKERVAKLTPGRAAEIAIRDIAERARGVLVLNAA